MAAVPDVAAWAQAVRTTMNDKGISQRELGEAVAKLEGRGSAIAQGTIGDWLRLGPPKAIDAIHIEEALGVPAGSQTQFLGFVPVEARPAVTFDEVVDREGRLTDQARRLLKGMYASALEG